MKMKKINLLVFLSFVWILGCSPMDELKTVPIYDLANLSSKGMNAKSITITDLDEGLLMFYAPMLYGFTQDLVEGDTYDTTVHGTPVTLSVTDAASGTKYESVTDDGTFSVTANENTEEFSIQEDFIFDFDLYDPPAGIDGTLYRRISATNYNGIDSFHDNYELKYYEYGSDGSYAETGAAWGEILKNENIFGILFKCVNVFEHDVSGPYIGGETSWDPREMSKAGLDAALATADFIYDAGTEYNDGILTEWRSYYLFVYNINSGTFDYSVTDNLFLFDDRNGDGIYYNDPLDTSTNGPDGIGWTADDVEGQAGAEELTSVLAGYGWTELP
jgi:hypothetical protein